MAKGCYNITMKNSEIISLANEEIYEKLNLRKVTCEDKKVGIEQTGAIIQQDTKTEILAPNTGFETVNTVGSLFVMFTILASVLLTAIAVRKKSFKSISAFWVVILVVFSQVLVTPVNALKIVPDSDYDVLVILEARRWDTNINDYKKAFHYKIVKGSGSLQSDRIKVDETFSELSDDLYQDDEYFDGVNSASFRSNITDSEDASIECGSINVYRKIYEYYRKNPENSRP